jgi:hypothetical protein
VTKSSESQGAHRGTPRIRLKLPCKHRACCRRALFDKPSNALQKRPPQCCAPVHRMALRYRSRLKTRLCCLAVRAEASICSAASTVITRCKTSLTRSPGVTHTRGSG